VKARGTRPFILIAPLVVTNGGPGFRSVPTYHYTKAVWDEVERSGNCRFDWEGISAAMADVTRLYGGEEKYFVTGWEAGGHTVWAMVFQHPELVRAAAIASPNYAGRWMKNEDFSSSPARTTLPVKMFQAGALPADSPLIRQMGVAKDAAEAHGFRNVSSTLAPGKPNGPLADEVMEYFASFLTP